MFYFGERKFPNYTDPIKSQIRMYLAYLLEA